MASEERKQQNNVIKEQNVHNALGAGEPEAETDAFQCGRCKNVRLFLLYIVGFSVADLIRCSTRLDTGKLKLVLQTSQ
jgi:hypothetical protein